MQTGTRNPDKLNVDAVIGARIHERRMMLEKSQTALGKAIGVSFQQIQKYEKGINSLTISRMKQMAAALGVPLSYFTDDLPDSRSKVKPLGELKRLDGAHTDEALKLVRAYYKVSPRLRRQIFKLATVLASAPQKR